MHKVKIIACSGQFCSEKNFALSDVPAKGRLLSVLSRRVWLRVASVEQNLDCDSVTVVCDANLDDLWILHESETGWVTADPKAFEKSKEVKKALAKRNAKMEKARREIEKETARSE